MRRGLSASAVTSLVAALALGACGSSSDNSSSSSTAAGSTPASTSAAASVSTSKGATGAPIVLGSICSCSGAQAASLGAFDDIINAWAKSVNAAGGINGHPVKLIVKDDGLNPAKSLQAAKELVESDHVMAIVGDGSLVADSWTKYIESKGVPVVGGVSAAPPFGTSPAFYSSGSELIPLEVGTVAGAKGKKNLGLMYCAEAPVCKQLVPLIQGIAKPSGLKVTPASISGTSPSYAAPCLTMKNAGVDALLVADNGTIVQRVIAGCHQQGYKPTNIAQASTTTNPLLKDPVLEGALITGNNANPYDASLPAVKEFQDALEKYSPGLLGGGTFAYDSYWAWTGGKLFEAAAKAGNITPDSTPVDVKKGLYALKGETLGGLAPPLTFTKGKPAFTPCWFNAKVQGGALVSATDNKPTCLPPAQAAALLKSLG